MNKRVLNNWAPFTVIPAGEFKNPKGEMSDLVPGDLVEILHPEG